MKTGFGGVPEAEEGRWEHSMQTTEALLVALFNRW